MADCPYAKSNMTPCVRKDGNSCFVMDTYNNPICVGCEKGPKQLGVPRPPDWDRTVANYEERSKRRFR